MTSPKRRHRFAPSTLLAVLALLVLTSPVAAGDFRGDRDANIAEGETVDDDLYVGAGTVSIAGTVNGDASIGAGTVTVSGTVNGSLNAAGGTVDVLGEVTGAVRVTGGTVRILGAVGRDVVILGGTVSIEPGAEVGGDVAGAGGSLVVGGTVDGDLLAGAGTIEISGTVNGSVDVAVEQLLIGPRAVVGGDITYTSDSAAQVEDGAQVGGSVERRDPPEEAGGPAISDNPIVSYLGTLLGMLLLGFGLLAIRPRLVIGSAQVLRTSPFPSLGLGAAAWVSQFVLVIVLVIAAALFGALAGSIAGALFTLAMVVFLLIVLLIFLAAVPVALVIGHLVLPGDDRSAYLRYLVGAAILSLVLVAGGYVPALGVILFLCVWILGLGAFVVYAWRTRNEPMVLATPRAPATPAAAPLPPA